MAIKKQIPEGSSELQEKFINCMMQRGKKSVSRRIFNDAMQILRDQGKTNPVSIFEKALENVKPTTEVRARRVGGSVYQIPTEVNPKRQMALSIRWVLDACRSRKGKPMADKLAQELVDASNETGAAFKKREDVHKMAQANKAFAHFARYK
jgi:small subunit ribosomal protein S7